MQFETLEEALQATSELLQEKTAKLREAMKGEDEDKIEYLEAQVAYLNARVQEIGRAIKAQ